MIPYSIPISPNKPIPTKHTIMKPTKFIAGLALFSFSASAYADVQVDITGATAFRAATLLAIKARFDSSGQSFQYAHDQGVGAFSGATRSLWVGTFPGVEGTTTIRTSFNGSVEGINALVNSPAADPTYYTVIAGNLITPAAIGGGETHKDTALFAKTTAASQSEIAFSDVSKAVTPYAGFSLQPANPAAGVVVFTMLTNEGSLIENVTSQQFRALFSSGSQPLSLFTGDENDTDYVYATGRNDGSGTRTTYLAETGYGVTNLVKQYVTNQSTSTALTEIQLVPAGGVNNPVLTGQDVKNASTVWGQDVAGNGGYSSGSTLRADMAKTGTAVDVRNEFGTIVETDVPLSLVTFLSLNDAVTAVDSDAVVCAYNGVKLDGIAAGNDTMNAADLAKVTNGAYTAWSYQQMYRRNDIVSGDAKKVYENLRSTLLLPANLGAAGIPIGDMLVGRESDGGVVAP